MVYQKYRPFCSFRWRIGYNPGVGETSVVAGPRTQARKRILDAAYDLFSTRGIRAVGIDEIVARAEVAKATLYRHFRTKDVLVLSFLERREELWTKEFVEAEARRRGATPEERLVAIFDVFDEWFHDEKFEACSFINTLLEMGPEHVAGRASIVYLDNIRTLVADLAEEAGGGTAGHGLLRKLLPDPDEGLDHLGSRGRPRGGPAGQGDRPARDRAVPLERTATIAAPRQ